MKDPQEVSLPATVANGKTSRERRRKITIENTYKTKEANLSPTTQDLPTKEK